MSFFLGFSTNAGDGFVGTDADDTLYGGSVEASGGLLDGNDTFIGGRAKDVISGGDRSDLLRAGRGDDRLIGGKGDGRMTGGLGNDIFLFEDRFGHDVIRDFDATADKVRICLVGVTAIETFADLRDNHMSAQGDDVVIDAGGDTIILLDVDLGALDRADVLL